MPGADLLAAQTVTAANGRRILVVDDNEEIRRSMARVLADDGFEIHTAADGEQAWSNLLQEHYDLLITDYDIPRLSGLELIQRIREAGMRLPVIIVSGFLSSEMVPRHLQSEIAALIPKPFCSEELLDRAKRALEVPDGEPRSGQGAAAGARQAELPASPRRHVMIVDDDDAVRESLASMLESEGYVVSEAVSGMEAVSRAIENHPDLVLLDLNMPHCDGWTAFGLLDKVTPLVPVIVITARPNQYETAVRLGVDAFMEKPLNIPILMRAVKHLTTEDESRHVRRITNASFITQLLDHNDS